MFFFVFLTGRATTKADTDANSISDANSITNSSQEIIRISATSLQKFGDIRASDPPRLKFIADRIVEQAVHGVCVVDELQNADGSAMQVLQDAVSSSAGMPIAMALSQRVGGNSKEQYGFFWNPVLVDISGSVATHNSEIIERDPAVATFKVENGFDFTLCAFHTRPDSSLVELKKELRHFDDIFVEIQEQSDTENDIIFLGDFNAPPYTTLNQSLSISESMGCFASNIKFVITSIPTNTLQTKIYDNVFFDISQTDEYISGPQHVVRIDQLWGNFQSTDSTAPNGDQQARKKYLQKKVMDHCPVYAEFRADMDTD